MVMLDLEDGNEESLLRLVCRYRADGKPAKGQPPACRIWGRVRVAASGCWEFQGDRDDDGYGVLRFEGRTVKAHRLGWIIVRGPLSDREKVCHHCDNPRCVRPSHLFCGTTADNNSDRHAKGRSANLFPAGDAHPRCVVGEEQKLEMRRLRDFGLTQRAIAERFGVSRGHVSHIVRGVVPKHRRGKA